MIYLFIGEYKKASQKSTALVEALLKKQPDATVLKFNSENFQAEAVNDLISTQGLFFSKNIIVFSKICEDAENKDLLSKKIKEIQASPNIFIFIEEKLDAKTFEKFKKHSEKIQELEEKEKKAATSFNMFSLTDALGERDKKNLWLLYVEAMKKNSAEEVYGILWWQIKTLLIAGKSKSAVESGLKPFVYSKSRDFLRNFKDGEIEKSAHDLISLYHNSRRQSSDLEINLEKWILSI